MGWSRVNLGGNSEDAEDHFDEVLMEQGSDLEDSDGEPRIKVKMNEEEVVVGGSRKSTVQERRAATRSLPHSKSRDVMDEAEEDLVDEDEPGQDAAPPVSGKSDMRGRSAATLPAKRPRDQQHHSSGASSVDGRSKASAGERGREAVVPEGGGIRTVDVLHARTKLVEECTEFTTSKRGSKSLLCILPEEVKKLSEDELIQLEAQPQKFLDDMQKKIAEIDDISVKAKKAGRDDVAKINEELVNSKREYKQLEKGAQEVLDGVEYIVKGKSC